MPALPGRSRARFLALALVLGGLLAPPAVPAVAARDFPAGYEGYHTYPEMRDEVAAVAAAHPTIVERFSIGESYDGRQLWAAKVSDNVALDENEPEVLFDGLTHSDEHMGLEMTLRILHWLVNGYGSDARITNIVNTREIWLVFAVNPDGGQYDIRNGRFHYWRKNRQPTPGSPYVGTDLNRNFGYEWGGGGRTSSNPQAITYRGPRPFSAPETRAMRDFLASRVVGGRQQIRTAITFHEYGRLVMWPYGYTLRNVPGDMTVEDHDALRKIGRHMAATNGYRPEQASDLYITSGTTRDFEYGVYRIFSYTFELSIRDYPDDSRIRPETGRNKEAVLYLIEHADCPYRVLGAAVRNARCGAFDDDLEVARGWTRNPDGTDTASDGRWARGNARATSSHGPKQLGPAPSGTGVFATGLAAGTSAGANDLDGGTTTVESPPISLPAASGQHLTFAWTFAHGSGSSAADELRVSVVDGADVAHTVLLVQGAPVDRDGAWRHASILLDAWAGQTVRLRFSATDGGRNNLVEAAFDDVRVSRPS
ncbi:MAG TPA: M14 family zinc carboxypeptidase [Candidatus Limnocylindrales bacterium]|nr:M14 family zinc carboxypeptidase [Candidatus Limnocylindrales bacterium]